MSESYLYLVVDSRYGRPYRWRVPKTDPTGRSDAQDMTGSYTVAHDTNFAGQRVKDIIRMVVTVEQKAASIPSSANEVRAYPTLLQGFRGSYYLGLHKHASRRRDNNEA